MSRAKCQSLLPGQTYHRMSSATKDISWSDPIISITQKERGPLLVLHFQVSTQLLLCNNSVFVIGFAFILWHLYNIERSWPSISLLQLNTVHQESLRFAYHYVQHSTMMHHYGDEAVGSWREYIYSQPSLDFFLVSRPNLSLSILF